MIFSCLQMCQGFQLILAAENFQQFRNLLFLNAGQHSQLSFWMLFYYWFWWGPQFCESMLFVAWIYGDQWAKPISESFGFYYLVPVVMEFFIVFFSSLSDPQPKQICLGYFITVGTYLFDLQSGLISAYIIKTMYFGRYTSFSIC